MLEYKYFLEGFQVNYFDYKQINNELLLDLSDEEIQNRITSVYSGSKEEFLTSVKSDIRLTFLLCLETLFELIFALLPDDDRKINDISFLKRMLEKNPYYDELRKYANNEESKLDILHKVIRINGEDVLFLRHIFYYKVKSGFKVEEINSSLSIIEKGLKELAKELINRDEINSYKHGNRAYSAFKKFSLINPETKEELSFDLSDSLTIRSFDKKTGKHTLLTKLPDPLRDITLTHFTSNLINNIIQIRRLVLNNDIKTRQVPIIMFNEVDLSEAFKHNVELLDLKSEFTPNDD